MNQRRLGVFCVEHWSSRLDRTDTLEPLMALLHRNGRIDFIHRRVLSVDELVDVVGRWRQKQYEAYAFGYFGFHGSPGRLHVGRQRLELDALVDALRGACRGKFIYFGSCAVLDLPRRTLDDFRKATGARAVLGYTEPVDWWESAAFDLLLLDAFCTYRRLDAIEHRMLSTHRAMSRRLGFKMVWR